MKELEGSYKLRATREERRVKNEKSHTSGKRILHSSLLPLRSFVAFAVFFVLHISITPCSAQSFSRAALDSLLHPALDNRSAEWVRFEQTAISLDTLSEDDAPRTVRFPFRNVGDTPWTIERVRTSCGCTASRFPREEILPGKTDTVSLTFNPRNRPGTVDVDAYVYTTSSSRPVARLRLAGYVEESLQTDPWNHLPVHMGPLRLKRRTVSFVSDELQATSDESHPAGSLVARSSSLATSSSVERLLCANAGTRPLKLTAPMLPACLSLHTEPEVIPPGSEADIVITLKRGKEKATSFPVILEGLPGRPSERTITVEIK